MTRLAWPVVGVDPGGRSSGVVVRNRDAVAAPPLVVVRRAAETMGAYCWRVASAVKLASDDGGLLIAVEDVNAPTPQMGTIAVAGLLGTAQVLGAVTSRRWDVIVVPPGGHGSAPLATYPPELVGEREHKGAGVLRHARSAFDVALAGHQMARITAAAGGR